MGTPGLIVADTDNPITVLSSLINSGKLADPQVIKDYLDLARVWKQGLAKEAYAKAMQLAQQEMPRVVRDKANTHTRSDYASLEQIQNAARPIYLKHGFTVSFSEDKSDKPEWIRVVALVRHVDGHSETHYREGPVDSLGPKGQAVKTVLHGAQSAFSYLTRQHLCGIFGLVIVDHDDDGNLGAVRSISDAQRQKLIALLEPAKVSMEQLCEAFGVENISELPQDRFNEAHQRLARKVERVANAPN